MYTQFIQHCIISFFLQKLSDSHPSAVEVIDTSTLVSVWVEQIVDIPAQVETFQIIIRGRRGFSFTGDAAIDDIQITPGNC